MTTLLPEPDYAGMTPPEMNEATRAHVIEGFRKLNRTPHLTPDLSRTMGVILADTEGLHAAALIPKIEALAFAKDSGVELEVMGRCAALNKPDALGILILTPQGDGFVEMPVQFIHLRVPQGEAS